MRRAIPVLAATGGVLALLANFHTTRANSGAVDTAAGTNVPTSTETAPSSASTSFLPPSTASLPSTTTPLSTTTSTAPDNVGAIIDGPVASNKWGDVQVRITISDRRMIDVQAIRLPDSNSHSAALSRAAQRTLREEALQAQSADIDLVSGATLTSESYIVSLQGALDRASR